jgi:hypothetical protein
MLTQPQREDLRYVVREQLVAAQTVALTAEMISRRVTRARIVDFPFGVADIEAALNLLVGLGQAKETAASLGATKFFQATAAGVLAQERGEQ